jgi:hypothetical protein
MARFAERTCQEDGDEKDEAAGGEPGRRSLCRRTRCSRRVPGHPLQPGSAARCLQMHANEGVVPSSGQSPAGANPRIKTWATVPRQVTCLSRHSSRRRSPCAFSWEGAEGRRRASGSIVFERRLYRQQLLQVEPPVSGSSRSAWL